MDRTIPREFVFSQYGIKYDPEIVKYGSADFTSTNQFLRGGVGTSFSFARDIDLTGGVTTLYGISGAGPVTSIWRLPENATHAPNIASDKPPILVIDKVGVVITRDISIQNAGGDDITTATFTVGLGDGAAITYPMCQMVVGQGYPVLYGTAKLNAYTYPLSEMTGTQLWVGLNGAQEIVVNFLVGDVASSATIAARIQATLDAGYAPGAAVVTIINDYLSIRSTSLLAGAEVRIAFGDPAAMARLGLTPGQSTQRTARPFTNNAGDAEFGLGATDKNLAINEDWGFKFGQKATAQFPWGSVDGVSQTLVCSPPISGALNRITLTRDYWSATPGDAVLDGQLTIWISGSILPAY